MEGLSVEIQADIHLTGISYFFCPQLGQHIISTLGTYPVLSEKSFKTPRPKLFRRTISQEGTDNIKYS